MRALKEAVAAILLVGLAPAHAVVNGSEKSQRLVAEGQALVVQRQYGPASEKFEAARKESPEASSPLSAFAFLLYSTAAGGATPEARAQLKRAQDWAQKALALSPDDPLANEVMRGLEDETPRPAYVENESAHKAFNEAEVLFHNGQYEAARMKYRSAYLADPKFAKALVMEGDTYFAEKNWAGAELMFNMAAESDPLDSQAWRFLGDARFQLGDAKGAIYAIMHAIAAMPSESGNWERLKSAVAKSDKPMSRLGLERKAWVQRNPATGKETINIASDAMKAGGGIDGAIWLAYASALTVPPKDGKAETSFQKELRAWSLALGVASELEAKGHPALQTPALLTLQKLHASGDLETSILLLMYREAYRPELEAWKKAHPQGVAEFADKWRLMP